jgi:hypothetical protein
MPTGTSEGPGTSRRQVSRTEGNREGICSAISPGGSWPRTGRASPTAADPEAHQVGRYRNLRAALPFIIPARYDVEHTSGGNPSYADMDYQALLAHSA